MGEQREEETLFLPSFTEILFYGKTFSLNDTWAEVELPSYGGHFLLLYFLPASGSHP